MNKGNIPRGWKKVRLGDCIEEIIDRTTQNNQYEVLSVTKDGIFSQEEIFKKQIASENNIGYKIIRKNNLVFSTMNLWMGSLDVLTNYEIGIVSPAYKIFKFNEELMLPQYGNYYMKSYYMLEQYKNCSEQGASIVRRNLDLKALLNVPTNIPPIQEQEKIVKILDNVSEIILKNESKINYIKNQKKIIEKKLFSKEMINKSKRTKLKDITKIITKGTTAKKFTKDGVNFIKIEALDGNHVVNKKCSHISEKEHNGFLKRSILQENDILFAIAGSIGKCALVKKENLPANTNQALAIIRLEDVTQVDYVLKVLESNLMKEYISINLTTGAQPNLNLEQIGKFEIPIIKNTEDIIKCLNIYEQIVLLIKETNEEYKSLKKALMQKLLTGKLRVKI